MGVEIFVYIVANERMKEKIKNKCKCTYRQYT